MSVLQHLGGAALLVLLVAALFWVIGSIGQADGDLAAGDEQTNESDILAEATDPLDPDPARNDDPEPETEEPVTDPPDTEQPEPEPEPTPDPEPEPTVETLPPEDISIQVLDGYQLDGGTAASGVAGQLSDAGYRIVARNPAIRDDTTRVLWTSGNEAAGRQVAAAIGAADVREQPGNLSTAVAVHVVVGADRG